MLRIKNAMDVYWVVLFYYFGGTLVRNVLPYSYLYSAYKWTLTYSYLAVVVCTFFNLFDICMLILSLVLRHHCTFSAPFFIALTPRE